MNLSIAQFTFGLHAGGQERVVADLATAFHSRGHKSLVCSVMFEGQLADELESINIPVQCLKLKKSYDLRGLFPVLRYLKENRVDVVISHGTIGSLIPRIAAVLSRVPVFIHVEHNISDHKRFYHIISNTVLSLFTDKIVCISENARLSLLKRERLRSDKAIVIPNGLNTDRFQIVKTDGKKSNVHRRIGIVARFFEQKGHIYFVEAARQIVKLNSNVEFVFIGDGYLRPSIEQKVNECGIQNYCTFLGNRSDVHELLQTLDVFVLSSLWEGLPISLLEAQYFGIACVVTQVGGNPEVVRNGYNGLLVPPRDPDALAHAILRVIQDDTLTNELSIHGQEMFREKFSIDKMVDSYLELIYGVLQEKYQGYRNNV